MRCEKTERGEGKLTRIGLENGWDSITRQNCFKVEPLNVKIITLVRPKK